MTVKYRVNINIPTTTKYTIVRIRKIEEFSAFSAAIFGIIFTAFQFGDIQDKKVVDLGCGTGIFSFGAKIANAKENGYVKLHNALWDDMIVKIGF